MPNLDVRPETYGAIRFYVEGSVRQSDMKDWLPENIRDFFAGAAQMLEAEARERARKEPR